MQSKRYPRGGDKSAGKELAVREAKAQGYAREKDRRHATHVGVGLNVASVKRRLKQPVKRSKRDIAWALKIAGIGEGPRDLSENAREYLYSDK